MTIIYEERLIHKPCLGCGSDTHALCRLITSPNEEIKYEIICPVAKTIGNGLLDHKNKSEFHICPLRFTENYGYDIGRIRVGIKDYERYGSGRKVQGDLSGRKFEQEIERICILAKVTG